MLTTWKCRHCAKILLLVVAAVSVNMVGCGPGAPSEEVMKKQQWGDPKKQMDLLGSDQPQVRVLAVTNLGNMGKAAAEAVPALEELLEKDPDPKVRDAADAALQKIRAE